MSEQSKIEWTDATWNFITGCDKVSAGCKNCYAETMANKLQAEGSHRYRNGFNLTIHEDVLKLPLKWKSPKNIFVNSMSDIYHKDVPLDMIKRAFDVMNNTPQHTYQILTKRSERLAEINDAITWTDNIWQGVSVEDSTQLKRVFDLQHVNAKVRFLSCEPLIGPLFKSNYQVVGIETPIEPPKHHGGVYACSVNLTPETEPGGVFMCSVELIPCDNRPVKNPELQDKPVQMVSRVYVSTLDDGSTLWDEGNQFPIVWNLIDWIIVGGESGPNARLMRSEWVKQIQKFCEMTKIPFFFKQWGGVDKKSTGRVFEDREWNEMPYQKLPGQLMTDRMNRPPIIGPASNLEATRNSGGVVLYNPMGGILNG